MTSLLRNSFLSVRHICKTQVCTRLLAPQSTRWYSDEGNKKATTPIGRLDEKWEGKNERMEPAEKQKADDPYAAFPGDKNPETGEIGGPRGPEPTRYGDWERKGRVIDF